MNYNNIFQEASIGKLKIKNRVVLPAMGIALANNEGEATDDMISYYEERAKGGCGLIIAGMTNVDDDTRNNMPAQLEANDGIHSHSLKKLADRVHKHGSKIFLQLDHPGRETALLASYSSRIVAPSAIACKYSNITPTVLTTREVKQLIGKFVISALIAKKSGFDGVELNASHGFLISQFLSPHTNIRDDKYGGSFTNRLNFLKEIILGIKEICGDDFPLSVRYNGDDFVPGGLVLFDAIEIGKRLERIGVDALNITSGTFESANSMVEPNSKPEGWKKHLAQSIRESVDIPIIACNALKSPKVANQMLEEGVCDFVGIGRGLIADSHWVNKAKYGQDDKIRKCISCLDCMTAISNGRLVQCGVNPRVTLENVYPYMDFPITNIDRPIVVIGGGPAGMEASITLRKRGFKVILFEKKNNLGGNAYIASMFPTKESMENLIQVQLLEIEELGVDVRLASSPTISQLKNINPYAIYIASGSHTNTPNYKGMDDERVIFIRDILEDKKSFYNKSILVIGSEIRQLSIADYIGENDNYISIFEESNTIAPGLYHQIKNDVMERLREKRVSFYTNYEFIEPSKRGAKFLDKRTNQFVEFEADHLIFLRDDSSSRDNSFVKSIEENFKNVFIIGDANKPANLTQAVRSGFINAYNL